LFVTDLLEEVGEDEEDDDDEDEEVTVSLLG